MRVAYDAGPLLGVPTGVGRYTGELAAALVASGVDVHRYAVSWSAPPSAEVARWRVPARLAQDMWKRFDAPVPGKLFEGCDVVHATNFVLPPTRGLPGVTTVHDLSFFRDDVFPGGERLRELVPWSLSHAAAVIAPTRSVADEVADRFGYPSDRITVTPEGVSPVFFSARPLADTLLGKMGIPGRFVLAVGTLEPRKNLVRLVEAWRATGAADGDWRLVLAGPKGWGPELPETPGVMPIGFVSDDVLPGLMRAADIFCYPSLYEGFGLPPLEAMAAGTACIAGDYPAASEVLAEAAVLVDPLDGDALSSALGDLMRDEERRRELAFMGRSHAAGFTWERTASLTRDVYARVADGG